MIYLLSVVEHSDVVSLPMIKFNLIADSIDFASYDTLMFTSKQAVVSADEIDESWKNYPCIAIGKATKKKIEELGGKVIYTPEKFYAKTLAEDIKSYFSDKNILYLRPKKVSFNSKDYLSKEGIALGEQIIYETLCQSYLEEDKPEKSATIIFTSPSTITCFFRNFSWDKSYTAVLIGEATREHLPSSCRYVVAEEPLITSCIEKAKEITKNSDI